MAKNKYDFIKEILESKKLTPVQRERILLLASKEISFEGTLEERIKKIEEFIFKKPPETEIKTENTSALIPPKISETPTYIPPKGLYNFLKDINQNGLLKSICHEIDSNELRNIINECNIEHFDFIVYRNKIQKEYKDNFLDNRKYYVHHRIKNLILAYLTGETYKKKNQGWTNTEKIEFNWNSLELEQWCIKNPNKVPHPDKGFKRVQDNKEFKLPKPIKSTLIKNKTIQYFSELVLHFKYLFHLRSDNSLRSIIEYQNKKNGWDDEIDFKILEPEFAKNIEFFTNVEALIECYNVLIRLIQEVVEKNSLEKAIVSLKLAEIGNGIEFSIHHLNSVFKKSLENITKDRNGNTFNNLIKHQINGMCDFYINADFGNSKHYQINIWDGKPKAFKKISEFEGGVEYILIFRK